MSTPQLERLREHCHRLRLYQIENELTMRLEQAAKKEVSYADFVDELPALEVGSKTQKTIRCGSRWRASRSRRPWRASISSSSPRSIPSRSGNWPPVDICRAAITCCSSGRPESAKVILRSRSERRLASRV